MHNKVNLLPEAKQQRLKEQRRRKLIITVASVIMVAAVGLPIILLSIKGAQALTLNRTQDQINSRKEQIRSTPDIVTMLTVKDHLDSLPTLYGQRTRLSKVLAVLPKVLPRSLRLTDLDISMSGSLSFKGIASTYLEVEKFYKALANYGLKPNPNRVESTANTTATFTNVAVVEESGPSGSGVTFTITANFSSTLTAPSGAQP